MHGGVGYELILMTMLASFSLFLCSCETRLLKQSTRTTPRVFIDSQRYVEYACDQADGAHISNLGLGRHYELPWDAELSVGAGGSLLSRQEELIEQEEAEQYQFGTFFGAVYCKGGFRSSVAVSAYEDEYAVAAKIVVRFGSR